MEIANIKGKTMNKQKVKHQRSLIKDIIRFRSIYLFILPAIVWAYFFNYRPIYGVIVAFQDFDIVKGFARSPFVGLKWFRFIVEDQGFWKVFFYTIQVSAVRIFLGTPFPIIFALLLNELKNGAYKKTLQTISYLPHFMSWVVVSGFVYVYLIPGGPVEQILRVFGFGENLQVLTDSKNFIWLLFFSGEWKEIGYQTIIYLAAISGIDQELYEASIVDGANRWKQTLNITIPCIMPTVILLFTLRMGGLISSNFEQVYNMQNPLIRSATEVLATYSYRVGLLEAKYSFGTALGLFNGMISFSLILVSNIISKKITKLSIW